MSRERWNPKVRKYDWFQVIDSSQLSDEEKVELDDWMSEAAKEEWRTRRLRIIRGKMVDSHTGEVLFGEGSWWASLATTRVRLVPQR